MSHVMVCHCNRVTASEVNDAIDHGAHGVDEVGEYCGAGTCCGSCRPTIEVLLHRKGIEALVQLDTRVRVPA